MINPFVVILPSAGSGSRFNSDIPKQYFSIGDKQIIEFCIDLFLEFDECQAICIPISQSDQYFEKISANSKLHFIPGGSSRAESVKKGFDFAYSSQFKFDDILIHDSVRPCLTKAELRKLLENFSKSKLQAAILAITMSDTLKLAEKHTIQSTINRENVWRALTPQLFSKEALKFAYNSNLENLVNLTDEASLFDNLDIEVMIIEGSSENIKITFKEDLKLVENILINQKRIKS